MSNEENILNSYSIQGAPTPYVPYPPTFSRSDPKPLHMTFKSPKPLVVFDGSPDDLAALVRDARRFRKLSAHYCDEANGRPTHGAIQLERWDAEWMDWVPLSNGPLAGIADALPEVEG